jgi:pimeloyl-ACP methyl ester carboxylesterase
MNAKATTLVILHGWGQDQSSWKAFSETISSEMPTVVFEFPGFGRQQLLDDQWGVPEYANWTKEQLIAIDGPIILLGHSFGGRVASYIASEKPEWLHGLILYGAPCLYRPSRTVKFKILRNKLFRKMGISWLYNTTANKDLMVADQNKLGKIFRKVVPFDQTGLLPKISVSTLLVWGEHDTAVPLRIAKEMKNVITKSTLVVIERAGHNAHQEKPHLFYGIIKNFIKAI